MPFANPYIANPYPYAYAQTLTTANQLYDITQSLVAGVYTISWSGGGTLNVDFYNGTTYVGTGAFAVQGVVPGTTGSTVVVPTPGGVSITTPFIVSIRSFISFRYAAEPLFNISNALTLFLKY